MKFTQEGKRFCFGGDFAKVVFSSPSIQGFSEFSTLKTVNDILYYYYSVTGYSYDGSKLKRSMVASTYDSPSLLELPMALTLVTMASKEESQIVEEFRNTDYDLYAYNVHLHGEDCYDITRYEREYADGETEVYYRMHIYAYKDYTGFNGITFNYLKPQEMNEFVRCVNAFIDYSLALNNKIVHKRNSNFIKHLSCRNKRLYQTNADLNYEMIYAEGDMVDIVHSLHAKENGKIVWTEVESSITNRDVIIMEIHEDGVNSYITVGIGDKKESIYVNNIVYMHKEANEEELHYNLDQIAQECFEILPESDKTLICTTTIESAIAQYRNVLLNRTWMCRNEHNLGCEGGIENTMPFAEKAVEKLRKLILVNS